MTDSELWKCELFHAPLNNWFVAHVTGTYEKLTYELLLSSCQSAVGSIPASLSFKMFAQQRWVTGDFGRLFSPREHYFFNRTVALEHCLGSPFPAFYSGGHTSHEKC